MGMNKILYLLLSAAAATQATWPWGPRAGKFQHLTNSIIPSNDPVPGYKDIYNGTFEQQLDHSDPSLGTFSQTFYYDVTYYKGAGSPIIMFAPQEANTSDYLLLLTDQSMAGQLAKKLGGATVALEHRYWGNSSPYSELTTANLTYLTLNNSILDCTNFASNVVLPFAPNGGSNAADVPWILMGGSYSGALTAWIEAKAPGTFWAYLASSAVVEAISNLWEYFKQIEYGMPVNCSTDLNRVVNHMDSVLEKGTAQEQQQLKEMFGLEELQHNDDFMEALANGPYLWQNPSFFVSNAPFYQFCDYVENAENASNTTALPGPNGVGLHKALNGYATWMKTLFLPGYCSEVFGYYTSNTTAACFDTYNATSPIFTDITLSNTADRQWIWFLCNQPFGFWQDGAPKGMPTIVSRLVNAAYFTRQCALYFPPGPQGQTYGIAAGATQKEVNKYTGGWFIENTTRLIYSNGQFDPWRDATVSSFYRPGGPLASTAKVPVYLVPEGNHVSDLLTANGKVNAGVLAVQQAELKQLSAWVAEFKKGSTR